CQTSSSVTLTILARTYAHQCQINYPPTQSDKGGKLNQSSHTLEERRVAHNTYRSRHLLHSVPSYASPLSDMCVTSVVLAICRKCLQDYMPLKTFTTKDPPPLTLCLTY
ncbi:hypothetical protein J6590_101632, partial [Homalodisca vitripennis]